MSDERETAIGRLLLSKKKTTHCRDGNYSLQWQNNLFMSAYYDLYETPSPNGSEEKKSLHARICPKETYTHEKNQVDISKTAIEIGYQYKASSKRLYKPTNKSK